MAREIRGESVERGIALSERARLAISQAVGAAGRLLKDMAFSIEGITGDKAVLHKLLSPISSELAVLGAVPYVREGNEEDARGRSRYWEIHFPRENRGELSMLLKSQKISFSGSVSDDEKTMVYNIYR